jgi:hypothetical protein
MAPCGHSNPVLDLRTTTNAKHALPATNYSAFIWLNTNGASNWRICGGGKPSGRGRAAWHYDTHKEQLGADLLALLEQHGENR